MPLTDTEIKRSKPKVKPFELSDSGGLYLWVTPSGGRSWRWTYRHEGKQKIMTFGRYPEVSWRARENCEVTTMQLATSARRSRTNAWRLLGRLEKEDGSKSNILRRRAGGRRSNSR